MLLDHLLCDDQENFPHALGCLAQTDNVDGWGIAYYPSCGDGGQTARGAHRAYDSAGYRDQVLLNLNILEPFVTVAHARKCTSGCCEHGAETIPNPHPFHRQRHGSTWTFVHNGGVVKERLLGLLDEAYLAANPPNCSEVEQCDPCTGDLVVDSELYYLFVMQKIEDNGWDVTAGICDAVTAMLDDGETGAMNFILTQGTRIWAFRKELTVTHPLYYLYDEQEGYAAVASEYPSAVQGDWTWVNNYELVVLDGDNEPIVIPDVRTHDPDWKQEAKLLADDHAPGDNFGRSVALSGDVAVIGAYYNDEAGANSGAAYVYRYNGGTWLEEAKLIAADAGAGDKFGESVSVHGDVAVIGASYDTAGAQRSGSAYVFRYNGVEWLEEARLTASDADDNDEFGDAVSVDGDVVVVGAWYDDDTGTNSGSAYVFRYNGEEWLEETKLTAFDAAPDDEFGAAVSVDGDVVVVGAGHDDDAGSNSGSAYVYRYDPIAEMWNAEPKLTAFDAAAGDNFGFSVSISGDVVVIGAYRSSDAGSDSGSAYVFRYDGASWFEETELAASDAEAGDYFGHGVSVDGSVVLIGASRDDYNCPDSGSAYVFSNTDGTWNEIAKLTAADGAGDDRFGYSVSVSGVAALVGAYQDDDAFPPDPDADSGSAHMFRYRPDVRGLLVDHRFNDSVHSQDLRYNAPGQDWYESREDDPDLLTLNHNHIHDNGTQKARLQQSEQGNAYLTQDFVWPQTNVVSLQWDIYVDSVAASDVGYPERAAMMLIGDWIDQIDWNTGPNSDDEERFVYMGFYKEGGGDWGPMDLKARDRDDPGGDFTMVDAGMNLDQWYTIDVVCYLSRGEYDIYVDREYLTTLTSRWEKTSVTHVSFAQWHDGAGTFYVDNVTTEPLPSPHLLVDADFDDSLNSEQLRRDEPGQDWYESRGADEELLTLDQTDVGGNATKKAKLSETGRGEPGNAYLSQALRPMQTGVFSAQWDIYVDSIVNLGNPDRAGWMLIGDDLGGTNGPNSEDGERFVYMAFYKDGGGTAGTMDLVARDRGDPWETFTTVAAGLNLDQWYTIKVICDLDADTYDVYVDGQYQATVTSRWAKTSVTHVSFAQWHDGAGTFFVDNVTATQLECTADTHCDDRNPCTTGTCEFDECVFTPVADGFSCEDGEFCNGVEACSNGRCQAGYYPCTPDEWCDENAEPSECREVLCGDGAIVGPEQCDDNNTDDGDGCSSTCTVEDGFICQGEPSVCFPDIPTVLELPVNPEHHARKHRYISIDATTNLPHEVSIKVEIEEMNRCQNDLRRSCIDEDDCPTVCDLARDTHSCEIGMSPICPDQDGDPPGPCIASGPCGPHPNVGLSWYVQEPQRRGNCPNDMCDEEDWYARVDGVIRGSDWLDDCNDPDWDGGCTTLHIGDCEIVPGVVYNVYACNPVDGDDCSDPLQVETTRRPQGAAHYGDFAGGVTPELTFEPPDGFVNVMDISAYLLTVRNWGTPVLPQAHPTWVDAHGPGTGIPPQYIIMVTDLTMVLRAWVNAWPYENSIGGLAPGDCP